MCSFLKQPSVCACHGAGRCQLAQHSCRTRSHARPFKTWTHVPSHQICMNEWFMYQYPKEMQRAKCDKNNDALSVRITTHCAIYSCKLHLQTQVELQLSRCHVVSSSLRLVRKCRRFHSNWTRLIHLLVPFLVRDSTWGLLVSCTMN